MEMTKQRKMLIGTLCLGLGGLLVDRFVLSTPDSASADDSPVVVEVGPVPESIAPTPTNPTTPAPDAAKGEALPSYASLTQRLILAQEQLPEGQSTQTREDPFALPVQWQTDKTKPLIDQPQVEAELPNRMTSLFKLDGTVRSLIDGKEEMMAVISGGGLDGRAIRVGQKIKLSNAQGIQEEYELVEVGSRYVVWRSLRTQEKIVMQVEEIL